MMEQATIQAVELEDGFHEDMPMPEYLAIGKTWDPATGEEAGEFVVSASCLKKLWWGSAAHLFHYLTEPEDDDSARKRLGSLMHAAILEPDTMGDQFAVLPAADPTVFTTASGEPSKNPRATAAYKEAVKEIEEANPGRTLVEHEQMVAARRMQESVRQYEDVALLLDAPGLVEVTVLGRDPITGLRWKVRPDKLIPDLGFDLNPKGCRSAKYTAFQRDVENFGHFLAAGFYKMVLEQAGFGWRKCILLALELDPPHVAKPWELDEGAIDAGEQLARQLLNEIAVCVESGVWPAYGGKVESMSLSEFGFRRVDERLEA